MDRWNLDAGAGFAPNEHKSASGEWVRWRDIEGMANELRLARESARVSDEAHAMHEAMAIERGSERDAARAEAKTFEDLCDVYQAQVSRLESIKDEIMDALGWPECNESSLIDTVREAAAARAEVERLRAVVSSFAVQVEIGQAGCQEVRERVCQICRASDYSGPLRHKPDCLLHDERKEGE
jgi:hypothetical protein